MDTERGLEQRSAVLEHVDTNAEVIQGRLSFEQSMGLTIARKK